MSKCVLFDLDNTLVHRNESVNRYVDVLLADCRDVGKRFSRAEILRLILECDNGGYLRPGSPHATIREEISLAIVERLGTGASVTRTWLEQHWAANFPACSVPMPGASDLVEMLYGHGISIIVVSNGSHASREATVAAMPFADKICGVLSSERARARKPARKIFELALYDHDADPEDCWFIGDHPVNDIHGARRAGMRTIWLQGFHPWPDDVERPPFVVGSLSEVGAILLSAQPDWFRTGVGDHG